MLKTGYVEKTDAEYTYIDDYFKKHIAKLDQK
jgi:hypothetical protein